MKLIPNCGMSFAQRKADWLILSVLSDSTGIPREYDGFTRRDVELAGEGRVTVNVSHMYAGKLRVFETECTDRQARQCLLELYEDNFTSEFTQWKDVTKS